MYISLKAQGGFLKAPIIQDFHKGLTTISGLNGKGKSTILELLEFSQWGVQALRGQADAYKGLKVEVLFELRKRLFKVERSTSGANLFEGNDKIATGTKPVNAKIEELFGYSYDVFRMTNIAKQGDIERMGNLKPTARKALIDETIGLAKIDALSDWVAIQYSDASSQAKAVQSMLGTEPEPLPEAPQEMTAEAVKYLQGHYHTYMMYAPKAVLPEPVKQHLLFDKLALLKDQEVERDAILARKQGLTLAIKALPEVGVAPSLDRYDSEYENFKEQTRKNIEANTQKTTIERALASYPHKSEYTDEQLEQFRKDLALWERYNKRKAILAEEPEEIICPNCDHHWHDGATDPRLKDYADVPDYVRPPLYVKKGIDDRQKINDYQETRNQLLAGLEAIKGSVNYQGRLDTILAARRALELYNVQKVQAEKRSELVRERDSIVIPESNADLIRDIELQERLVANYLVKLADAEDAAKKIEGIVPNIADLLLQVETSRTKWTEYEFQRRAYQQKLDLWNSNNERLQKLHSEVSDWHKVKQAIADLRIQIKGYLLPSLNDVSTRLIHLMSNGWLNQAKIDEDFNIVVDGLELSLLSGAGKVLTNLALRIGLGQVLTNSVFSVLMLDEADAMVDVEKAPMVAEALRALTGTIVQIIVVSHKQGLQADHRIEL